MLKISFSFILFTSFLPFGYGQSEFILGKWYVVQKSARTDLEVPTRIQFSRDSVLFNSMDLKDSMQCKEFFLFNSDATFNQSGKCLPIDSLTYGFKYYGIDGTWKFIDKKKVLLDYLFGFRLYHYTFRFRIIRDGFSLKLKEQVVEELSEQ